MNALLNQIKDESVHHINLNLQRIGSCLDLVSEQEAWYRPNAHTNSIGNLVLHLCGNISQYILSGLGGAPDRRRRDDEFDYRGVISKDELFQKLTGIVEKATTIIKSLNEQQVTALYKIQSFEMTGTGILVHVTEHFSYHTGQVALIVKLLKKVDIGFYAGIDLNRTNG